MRGKFKRQSALGESCMNRFSDRGSTPLGSTKRNKSELFRESKLVRICFLLLNAYAIYKIPHFKNGGFFSKSEAIWELLAMFLQIPQTQFYCNSFRELLQHEFFEIILDNIDCFFICAIYHSLRICG